MIDEMLSLKIQNLKKKFFDNVVLKNISFDLHKGEILSLVGENGAGKSTLMKIINGVYPHDSYEGHMYDGSGRELKFHSSKDANKFGIAMIYQEINVEYDLSVAENIMLGLWPKNRYGFLDWKRINKEAESILKKLNCNIKVNTLVRSLSASQQQITCIARALVRKPKILILDEPTASLTGTEINVLFDIIKILQSQGISCIYISHRLAEIVDISDRVIVLRNGVLVSVYKREKIDRDILIKDMIGKDIRIKPHNTLNNQDKIEALRVENLTLENPHNKQLRIIENVNFTAYKGEVLGIAGMLGSGRSELLRSIYGAYPKISGNVFIAGKSVSINSVKDGIRSKIGFLTEDRKKDGFVKTMSVKHNTSLNILETLKRFILFLSFKLENKMVSQFLEKMNYRGPSYQSNILYLSGGNQQKVIFSKILMSNSDILLLDEPTRGIDVGAKDEIYDIIDTLRKEGVSIIVVSSEYSELIRICSRIVVLYKNNIIKELAPEEFTEESIVRIASFGS